MTPPLYVHRPDSQSSTYLRTEASVETEWAMRMSENCANKVPSLTNHSRLLLEDRFCILRAAFRISPAELDFPGALEEDRIQEVIVNSTGIVHL